MSINDDELREGLLGQLAPPSNQLASYREEMITMIAQHEKRLRVQKWYVSVLWIFAVLLVTVFLLIAGLQSPGPHIAIAAGFVVLIAGGVELVKYFMNRQSVELLKEIKGLELQVVELKELLLQKVQK